MTDEDRFSLIQTPDGERLLIEGLLPDGFEGAQEGERWLCPLNAANAAALRRLLPWTAPVTVGLRKSVGCGDRLGLATPGHILAVRGSGLFPVFAQQSIREMQRAGRSAQEVFDDATWGVFRMNFRDGFGCDADHLKNTDVIDLCISVGFIGFTLDPSTHVDNAAHTDTVGTLRAKFAALPWEALETTPEATEQRYTGQTMVGMVNTEMLHRAACKYGRALADVTHMARHIIARMGGRDCDIEVSVDETDTPTTPFEHCFFASELKRLGVRFQGLAPRFVGDFEKGVDYIGDLGRFEQEFAEHARVARELGPYKLSIHSGSDKFSIYPIIARHAGPYVHLKTAGTSWLEALRVTARFNPGLFQAMLDFAVERYPTDRASYHVSAQPARIPSLATDERLVELLDQFDARQILHVTFGSLMSRYRQPLYDTLHAHAEAYQTTLKLHFERHITPFTTA